MKRLSNAIRFLVLASLIALAPLAIPLASAEVIERIVAIVNNEIISMTDISRYADRLRNRGLTDDLLIPDDATRQAVLQDREKLLQKMIDEKLIDSEVKRQNLQVAIERVEQEIRTIARRNNVTREQLQEELKRQGVSVSQYQDFIKTGLERQSLMEKAVTSKIKITDQDVLNYYAQHNKGPEAQLFEFTLAHAVFLKAKDVTSKARSRAELFEKRLKSDGNFEKLAGEMSEDPNFEAGGKFGTFRSGELVQALEQAVKNLSSGDVSGIVESPEGFHILKVLDKKLIPDPRFEQERDKISQVLYDAAYKRQLQSWLEQLRQDAFLRINK